MLGISLNSIGQKRYPEDSTRMTEDSSWCEPHYREDGRVDNLIMVSSSYPLLLIRNNEPVTGIVYTLFPNGNISYEKHYKNGFPIRHEKVWWPNGKLGNIIKYYSKQKIGYRTPKKEKEWYENGQIKSKFVHHGIQNKTINTSWYENGQIKKKEKRLNNSSTNECWDEDGNKIECD